MTTLAIKYGDHLPTGYLLQESIKNDIYKFKFLIDNLKFTGYVLLGYNDEGIIIEEKEIMSVADEVTVTGIKTYMEEKIISLKEHVNSLISRISYLEGRIYYIEDKLEDKLEGILEDKKSSDTDKPKTEACAAEFFLLYDLLPEHIKKEIKIHIKKQ